MGNVRINSDVQLGGELRAPRIEGELGIETGSINLDELSRRPPARRTPPARPST
jgi:hypothetical protein